MLNSRQADPASVLVRSFGVTFRNSRQVSVDKVLPPPAEGWHLLIYASRGVVTVQTDRCAWVVPPHRAVWIPEGVCYRVEMSGVVALRALYLRTVRRWPIAAAGSPPSCTVVNITPLLRELILRTVQLGALDASRPEQRRIIGIIQDELKALHAMPLQLPMPRDSRASRFAALVNADPGADVPTSKLFRACGASRRTLERLFRAETAMSLGQWVRRQRLLHGLRLLAAGSCVNAVALELGYNSASAFIAMFRRELGQTPTRYFER